MYIWSRRYGTEHEFLSAPWSGASFRALGRRLHLSKRLWSISSRSYPFANLEAGKELNRGNLKVCSICFHNQTLMQLWFQVLVSCCLFSRLWHEYRLINLQFVFRPQCFRWPFHCTKSRTPTWQLRGLSNLCQPEHTWNSNLWTQNAFYLASAQTSFSIKLLLHGFLCFTSILLLVSDAFVFRFVFLFLRFRCTFARFPCFVESIFRCSPDFRTWLRSLLPLLPFIFGVLLQFLKSTFCSRSYYNIQVKWKKLSIEQ